jgi:DNA polymerase I-like protein with 3'-5' exonuclease and polymerase domains
MRSLKNTSPIASPRIGLHATRPPRPKPTKTPSLVVLAAWHEEAWTKAKAAVDQTHTIFGRLLCAQGEREWDRFQVDTGYRVAGSAADVIKNAMVKIVPVLPFDVRLIATVHDELIFDCPCSEAAQFTGIIRMVMEDSIKALFGPELPIELNDQKETSTAT